MPVGIKNPITIPAQEALVADKLSVDNLSVSRQGEKFIATAHVSFFAEDSNGDKKYARQEDGTLVTDAVSSNDLFAEAATLPSIGIALQAIQDAVAALYDAKKDQENQPVTPVPVTPTT